MSDSTWQRTKEIFDEARFLPAGARADFLTKACADDDDLREQVESLLASYDSGFLEESAFNVPDSESAADILTGKAIGRYRVRGSIGSGGMGEVFLADDTELDRPVAFKVLQADVAQDQERVRRFIQEARAASALNHPNILTIHEIGSYEDSRFIVSEYVDGQTLREKMRQGLSVRESIAITCQVAAALKAAHAAGIVHRDIKPENVMVRGDGLVKVLDFGLAKLTEADDSPIDPVAPAVSRIQTSPGLVMGTVTYMSPEQARGQAVDARADLWSLGVVLHEMLTGQPPYKADAVTEVVAAIVAADRTPIDVNDIPAGIRPICERALAKERDSRYQSAHDLLTDLEGEKKRMEYAIDSKQYVTVSSADEKRTQLIGPRRTLSTEYFGHQVARHKYLTIGAIMVVAFVVFGLTIYRYNAATRSGGDDRVSPVITSATTEKDLKFSKFVATGRVVQIAISPNGKYIAYVTDEGPGKNGIRIRDRETNSDTELVPAPTAGDFAYLSFSPTSDQLLYVNALHGPWELYRVPIAGGTAAKIGHDADGGGSLSPDGKTLAFARDNNDRGTDLVVSDPDGSNMRVIAHTSGGEDFVNCGVPAWTPDGGSVVCGFVQHSGGQYFIQLTRYSLSDGSMQALSQQKWRDVSGVIYMPDGTLLIAARAASDEPSAGAQLWVISRTGEAKRITNDVAGYSGLSATSNGDTLVTLQSRTVADIWTMMGTDLSKAQRVTASGEFTGGFNWTPDGRFLFSSNVGGNRDIWLMNADGSGRTQLTQGQGFNLQPFMTSNGRYVVYLNSSDPWNTHVFRMDADGQNRKQLTFGELRQWSPRLSPDGKWVYYVQVPNEERSPQLVCKVSIDGGEPVVLATIPDGRATIFDVSNKDGRLIVEYSDLQQETPVRHIAIISPRSDPAESVRGLPRSAIKFDLPPSAPSSAVRWAPDGRHIAFRDPVNGIRIMPLSGNGKPRVLMQFPKDYSDYRWSHDGRQMAFIKVVRSSEALQVTNKNL